MKIKITFQVIVAVMTLCFFAQGTFAYAPLTTHAGLTQEMLAYYQVEHGGEFSRDESELIIQGSIDEDNPSARALNHFYDPIHGTGINGYRPAIVWATDETSSNNFTWKKGIDAYAHGDSQVAYVTLGHILHLLEDSSVPDHTRNDPHMGHGIGGLYTGASPFEDWAEAEKTRETLAGFGANLHRDGFKENACVDVFDCFNFMASYSNGNFFSQDSVNSSDYKEPIKISEDNKFVYGKDNLTENTVKLLKKTKREDGIVELKLTDDVDTSVLSEYFDRLTPQTISVGSRVIDLYLAEAKAARDKYLADERAKQDAALRDAQALNNKLENAGTLAMLWFGFKDLAGRPVTGIATLGSKTFDAAGNTAHGLAVLSTGTRYGSTLAVGSSIRAGTYVGTIALNTAKEKSAEGQALATKAVELVVVGAETNTQKINALFRELTAAKQTLEKLIAANAAQASAGQVAGAATVVPNYTLLANSLGSGGGGGGNSANTTAENSPTPTQPFNANSQGLGGEGGAGRGGDATSTDTTATSTDPMPEETPPEETPPDATTTPDTTVPDAPLVTSPTTTSALFSADTAFVVEGTAEASSTIIATFVGTDPLLVMLAPVTASGTWSFSLNLPEENYLLSFTAVDTAGNISSSTELVLSTVTPPPLPEPFIPIAPDSVLLYEIAWQGTRASATDEWLEIKNVTDTPIDLATLRIETSDGGLAIPLSGTLDPHSFAVIAADPGALVGVTPTLIADFGTGLDNTGEDLRLVQVNPNDLTTTVIDELTFCADWCGKGASPGTTMGRTLGTTGDTADDWVTTPYGFFIATDRDGGPITGTPFLETVQVIPD